MPWLNHARPDEWPTLFIPLLYLLIFGSLIAFVFWKSRK
jgi:hypothetical protein